MLRCKCSSIRAVWPRKVYRADCSLSTPAEALCSMPPNQVNNMQQINVETGEGTRLAKITARPPMTVRSGLPKHLQGLQDQPGRPHIHRNRSASQLYNTQPLIINTPRVRKGTCGAHANAEIENDNTHSLWRLMFLPPTW